MTLTAQHKSDVRRYAGYSLRADVPATPSDDDARVVIGSGTMTNLAHILDNLSAEEEAVLITTYLLPLWDMENDIVLARSNLDTDVAAVWTHNRDEVAHRTGLFDLWRRRMCGFLGLTPGPALGGSIAPGGANIPLVRG